MGHNPKSWVTLNSIWTLTQVTRGRAGPCLTEQPPERKGAAPPEQGNNDRSMVERGAADHLLQLVCMSVYMCAAPMGITEIVQSARDLWPFLLLGSLLQLNSFAHGGYESGRFSDGKQSTPKICTVNKFNHCMSARQE